MKPTINVGTIGHCPKLEDYHGNVPSVIISSAPKSDRRVICVGATDHSQVPKELVLNGSLQMPVLPFPSGGPVVKSKGLKLLWNSPEHPFDEKILYYRGERMYDQFDINSSGKSFYTGLGRRLVALEASKSTKELKTVVLRYEGNGGLLVAGQVVWCMPWGDYTNQEQSLTLLPSKDYLRGVVAWFLNQKGIVPAPKPEQRKAPIVDLYSRSPVHYFIPYGNVLRDAIKHVVTGRPKDSWEVKIRKPKFDPYMLLNPNGPHIGYFAVHGEDSFPIGRDPSAVEHGDPVAYAEAVENGYVGTFEEWQWSEFDK